jgi:hypothetical protein
MKNLISIIALFVSVHAYADTATVNEGDLVCPQYAKAALAKAKNLQPTAISFYNGAMVADGAYAVEIDVYKVVGVNGLYKVELDADGCDLRNIELLN